MINFIAGEAGIKTIAFIGILFAFAATCLVMWKGMGMLPRDQGREFAVERSRIFICPGIYCGGTSFWTGKQGDGDLPDTYRSGDDYRFS